MIITLKSNFYHFKARYFFCFVTYKVVPSLWAASGVEALVRHARTEGHKRGLWPLPQSVDNAGWASQHVSAPTRCCKLASMGGKPNQNLWGPGDKGARTRCTDAQMHRGTVAQMHRASVPPSLWCRRLQRRLQWLQELRWPREFWSQPTLQLLKRSKERVKQKKMNVKKQNQALMTLIYMKGFMRMATG